MDSKIRTFVEKDIYPDSAYPISKEYAERPTVKAIIFDSEGNIAIVGKAVHHFFTLPGGGVDQDESLDQAIVRECLEEVGCEVSIERELGIIDDYRDRDSKHVVTHCYVAKVVGEKQAPSPTEEEAKLGFFVRWVPIHEALNIIGENVAELRRNRGIPHYNAGFNIVRDHLFLKEYIDSDFPQS